MELHIGAAFLIYRPIILSLIWNLIVSKCNHLTKEKMAEIQDKAAAADEEA